MTLLLASLIGITIALLGSGGTILSLPILMLALDMAIKEAIVSAMVIVGILSFLNGLHSIHKKHVHWPTALFFGLSIVLSAYWASVIGQEIPDKTQALLFSIITLVMALRLFHGNRKRTSPPNNLSVFICGLFAGVITGMTGVGGGFLIVPVLAIYGGLSFKKAIGTSLIVITANCAVSFYAYQSWLHNTNTSLDYPVLLSFIAMGVVGSLVGTLFKHKTNERRLQQVFSVSLLIIASYTTANTFNFI